VQSASDFHQIEAAFQEALDESLAPRGPEFLYEVVSPLALPRGAFALDVGCGAGKHSLELARRFGFSVLGIDPDAGNIEAAREALRVAAAAEPGLRGLVRFEEGAAEALPVEDSSAALIWCREVLMFADPLEQAFSECRRVLREDGQMLVYQVFATERLEPREAAFFFRLTSPLTANWFPETMEAALTGAGLRIQQLIELTSEGGEHAQEQTGEPGRRLLHAARLLRDPERYIERFGRPAYDTMLADCFWHVYRMIGKLSARVYVLRR
jgi:SAM-dependent methyltransferase